MVWVHIPLHWLYIFCESDLSSIPEIEWNTAYIYSTITPCLKWAGGKSGTKFQA